MEIVKRNVVHIQKKLENIIGCGIGGGQVLDLLKALQDLHIDGTVLTKTKIYMTVNALRKSNFDNQVVGLVNDLTKEWKKIIAESSSGKENRTPSENSRNKQKEAENGKQMDQERCASTLRQLNREARCAAFKVHETQKKNLRKVTSPPVKARRASTDISLLRYPQLRLRGEISSQSLENLKAILMFSVEMA